MASSSGQNKTKASQYSRRKFAEQSLRTLVGIQKNEVKLKKEMETLEQQQNTSVNNIANHQQAMKMSWRRLEEKKRESPLLTRAQKDHGDAKSSKRGMLLQSSTKLYVDKTPDIYSIEVPSGNARPTTVDDQMLGRGRTSSDVMGRPTTSAGDQGFIIHKQRQGPPPTQLTRSYTSPYISSPHNFRKTVPMKMEQQQMPKQSSADDPHSDGSSTQLSSNTKLSDSQEFNPGMLSSSQPQPLRIRKVSMNKKETLLRASTLMDISSGPEGFKNFYSTSHDRPRSQTRGATPIIVSQQIEEAILLDDSMDQEIQDTDENEIGKSNSEPTLAEQFEQIKNCKYIRHSRHYNPERVALEEC